MERKKVTKPEITAPISFRLGLAEQNVTAVVDGVMDELKGALAQERTIELRGFGTFEIRGRSGRARARNPKTGKLVAARPHGVAVFRPGRELKAAVWPVRREHVGSKPGALNGEPL